MTKKFTRLDMFQELSVILARIEDKLDRLQKDVDSLKPKNVIQEPIKIATSLMDEYYKKLAQDLVNEKEPKIVYTEQKCYFDSLSPEDRMKPMSISCPCKRCSPYSMSGGSVTSSDFGKWSNPVTTSLGAPGNVEITWTMEDGSQLTELVGKHKHE